MRKFLLFLLVLVAVGLVAADRIGVRVAENQIGRQVAQQYDLAAQPDVTIHGIPFLTQALGGEYERIDVSIGDWTGQGVTVGDVKIDMRGVRAPLSEVAAGNASNVVARTATASAVLPYSVIKERAPKEVQSIAQAGDQLKVQLSGQILGFQLDGDATIAVKPTARGIQLSPTSVGTGGVRLPVAALSWYVPITDLPVGSRISRVEPTPEGVRVSATAENVKLSELEQIDTPAKQ
ncbi:DUF2993 domain-containing protein [Actinomadura flavalba]|uniref:LmeA family phospholipid-binding protein n=1 Tax=Actinomadura flavalba TaxID=1120938 RepID=UPI00037260F3|nr:DUF2993 domain-containing protein [Actinomadura flavalba]